MSEAGETKQPRVLKILSCLVALFVVGTVALSLLGQTVSQNACAFEPALGGNGSFNIQSEEQGRELIEEMRRMNCMGLDSDIAKVEQEMAGLNR